MNTHLELKESEDNCAFKKKIIFEYVIALPSENI